MPFQFNVTSHAPSRRKLPAIRRIAKQHGCSYIGACGSHWIECDEQLGAPFDGRLTEAVGRDLRKAGLGGDRWDEGPHDDDAHWESSDVVESIDLSCGWLVWSIGHGRSIVKRALAGFPAHVTGVLRDDAEDLHDALACACDSHGEIYDESESRHGIGYEYRFERAAGITIVTVDKCATV